MPKKNDKWIIGMPKGPTGPFVWQVWLNDSKKPLRVIAFDQLHIQHQLEGKVIKKANKLPEEKEPTSKMMPLGPKGYKGSSRPADYDAGFKVLRQWIDSKGGPPEEIRKKLRELWIDYDRVEKKRQ